MVSVMKFVANFPYVCVGNGVQYYQAVANLRTVAKQVGRMITAWNVSSMLLLMIANSCL